MWIRTGRAPRRTSMGLSTRLLMWASQRGRGIAVPHCLETRVLLRRDRLPLGLFRCSGAKHDNAHPDKPDDLEKAEDVDGVQQRRNDRGDPRNSDQDPEPVQGLGQSGGSQRRNADEQHPKTAEKLSLPLWLSTFSCQPGSALRSASLHLQGSCPCAGVSVPILNWI